jgi:hypothetical protein
LQRTVPIDLRGARQSHGGLLAPRGANTRQNQEYHEKQVRLESKKPGQMTGLNA